MTARISIILAIIISLVSLYAQDNLPVYSAVEYEVEADSLLRTNQPQDIQINISCSSPEDLDAYEIKIYDLRILWMIVSANLNDQPVWLVNSEKKSEKKNVLAWTYDSAQNLLRLYPAEGQSAYTLELMLRASILEPTKILSSDTKIISLEVDVGGQMYQCSPRGSGIEMSFKRKVQSTR